MKPFTIGRSVSRSISIQSFALSIVAAGVLTSCQTPPPAVEPPPSVAPPAAAPVRQPELPAPPPPLSGPASPEARAQAQKLSTAAADLLQSGNEDQARSELKQALVLDPQNKNALSLTRQITSDPIALLGRESFAYTVRPGDTLAGLAQRFLGEAYSFYALARYNDIKVPRQLASGQVIRIPGKAPPPGTPPLALPPPVPLPPPVALPIPPATPPSAPPPVPAPPSAGEVAMRNAAAAERAGDLSRARDQYLAAERLGQPGAGAKAEQMRTQLITRWTLSARNAQIRQDLDGAIGDWQKVLDLDPDNSTARLGMARARDLKDKLGNVPK